MVDATSDFADDVSVRKWWKKRKGKVIATIAVMLITVLVGGPYVAWHLRAPLALDIIVVDKTIPKPDYRKHAGLFWVFSHEKVVQRATGQPLERARDYVGYHPKPDGSGQIVPIPAHPADLIYLSDTYGVYDDDLLDMPRGARSNMIYGGISASEVRLLLDDLRPGGTLVGEFNTLASPTPAPARALLAATFGIQPTGWVGRHFAYLDLTPDLPSWIPTTWKAQTGQRWQFRGPGYVFVSERGQLVVLVEGVDTPEKAIRIHFPSDKASTYGTVGDLRYDGWVEIVQPDDRAEVIATYEIRVTESGAQKLRGLPIAGRIPAAVRTQSADRTTYYFAGDWAYRPEFSRYGYWGLPRVKRIAAPDDRDGVEPFFWGMYVPLMQHIIREAATRSGRRAD